MDFVSTNWLFQSQSSRCESRLFLDADEMSVVTPRGVFGDNGHWGQEVYHKNKLPAQSADRDL